MRNYSSNGSARQQQAHAKKVPLCMPPTPAFLSSSFSLVMMTGVDNGIRLERFSAMTQAGGLGMAGPDAPEPMFAQGIDAGMGRQRRSSGLVPEQRSCPVRRI